MSELLSILFFDIMRSIDRDNKDDAAGLLSAHDYHYDYNGGKHSDEGLHCFDMSDRDFYIIYQHDIDLPNELSV